MSSATLVDHPATVTTDPGVPATDPGVPAIETVVLTAEPMVAPPRLRRSAVPDHEPRGASRVSARADRRPPIHGQETLAFGLPDDPVAGGADRDDDALRGDERGGVLPEPKVWAAGFIQAAMEVASGLRSAGQLVRWTTPEVHAILVRRGALTIRARRTVALTAKPRLRALNACVPKPGVCEIGAVIAELDRVRAVAFRMEGTHGRWRVTALEIG